MIVGRKGVSRSAKTGKIKSVYCENFVTYGKCVFHPSEYLNVIIGPNGTGKSTLVSAIVLGLGGDPKILARSSSIGDYVKNGCESAKVLVEIFDQCDDTTKFQRRFDLHGKSQYFVNDQAVAQKKFLECVNNYKIQIGNLCQFLPQDRVQDFAKMNPQEILLNTINSVCSQDVIENFQKLKDLRKTQENGKSDYKNLKQKLDSTLVRVEELKVQLELFNVRKDIQDKLSVCMAKKLRLEIEEIQNKLADHENDLVLAKEQFAANERDYQNVLQKQSMIDTTTEKFKKEIEEKKRKRDSNERQNEIKKEVKMLQVYAQDLKILNTEEMSNPNREQRLREYDLKMEQLRQAINHLNQEHRNIQNKLEENIPEIQSLKSRLESLENVSEQKMKYLRDKFPDVYNAVRWIDENADMFEGRVYKPVILELTVMDQNYAKYLENIINIRDLLAFSCESASDLSLLATELCSKRKLQVNICHAPVPSDSIFTPKIPIDEIRQYGFKSYLINLVNGPRAVLGCLCSLYNLQNIPYGNDNVNSCTDQIPHDIRSYFGGDNHFTLTISRYGQREASLMQRTISSKGLLCSRNDIEINAIKSRLNELTRKADNLRNQRNEIEVKIREKKIRYEEVFQVKKELQAKEIELKQKIVQLDRQQKKIETLKRDAIVTPEVEEEFKQTCKKAIEEILKLQKEKIEVLKAIQKAMESKSYSTSKFSIFRLENDEIVGVISATKEKRDTSKNRVEVISNKCNNLKRDVKQKLSETLKYTNQMEPTDRKYPYKQFYNSLTGSLEELRDIISDLSGRLDCMDNVNGEIVREYDAKRNEVEALQKDIDANLHGNDNYLCEIKKIYDTWYPIVNQVVTTINDHFGQFMESMGYVGEVKLVYKEEHDFESYGIEILVQYRKNVPLQALNRHVQSGGERAVAIAVYTMSMQHITHVPFRCVDEINQGMDARNERKIFEMLVDETTKTGNAQYFFVTPKLLPKLKTNERMTVHVVFNGRMVQSQKAFAVI
ncbi:structural maintenance of chromosomes protein 5 [Musca vetustissima]|uniref:structural maintenance of chromosomes protein 5 n=1 Tax=Musca vetustissima TaxID=27455 RepID=UPI002AB72951|nr:structural maintenance of chromosomes protein 5 [Musca vetustissima]